MYSFLMRLHCPEIGNRINEIGLKSPSSHGHDCQLLVASGPSQINNVTDFFPKWLIDVYFEIYESSVGDQNNVSLVPRLLLILLRELLFQKIHWNLLCQFGQFPEAIDQLLENRIQLNRLLGLSNLFYIDPDDEELSELCCPYSIGKGYSFCR